MGIKYQVIDVARQILRHLNPERDIFGKIHKIYQKKMCKLTVVENVFLW